VPDERQAAADTLAVRVLSLLRGLVRKTRRPLLPSSPIYAQAAIQGELIDRRMRKVGEVLIKVFVPRQEVGSPARVVLEWTRTAVPVWWRKEAYVVDGADDPGNASLSGLQAAIFDVKMTAQKTLRLKYLHRKYPRRRRSLGRKEPEALGAVS